MAMSFSRGYHSRRGTGAHSAARILSADVREPLPGLLLPGPPGDPRGRLRPGGCCLRLARLRPGTRGRRDHAPLPGGPADLDPDRVLAAPARLPLGAAVPGR